MHAQRNVYQRLPTPPSPKAEGQPSQSNILAGSNYFQVRELEGEAIPQDQNRQIEENLPQPLLLAPAAPLPYGNDVPVALINEAPEEDQPAPEQNHDTKNWPAYCIGGGFISGVCGLAGNASCGLAGLVIGVNCGACWSASGFLVYECWHTDAERHT